MPDARLSNADEAKVTSIKEVAAIIQAAVLTLPVDQREVAMHIASVLLWPGGLMRCIEDTIGPCAGNA